MNNRILLTVVVGGFLWLSCSSDKNNACDTNGDCNSGEICSVGHVCLALCNASPDCPVGWACDSTAKVCLQPEVDPQVVQPDTRITLAPAPFINATSADFKFDAYAPYGIVGYECNLDDSGYTACGQTLTLANLSAGLHILKVRAVDFVNYRDPTPAETTWTVDLMPPQTRLILCPTRASLGTAANVSFDGLDNNLIDHFECQIGQLGALAPSICTSPYVFLAPIGIWDLTIFAVDKAGNRDTRGAKCTLTVTSP
jgi:hypothetical protein